MNLNKPTPSDRLTLMQQLPLDFLKRNEAGVVFCVDGDVEMTSRLAEMGLREGAPIRMVQPGSPCIVDLNGSRMTLRLDERVQVLVDVCAATPAFKLA